LPCAFIKVAGGNKFINVSVGAIARVQGQQGIRPKPSSIILCIDFVSWVIRAYRCKRARKPLIRPDEMAIEIKCLHINCILLTPEFIYALFVVVVGTLVLDVIDAHIFNCELPNA